MKIKEVIRYLEEEVPLEWQEEWDSSGLQIGDVENEVKGVYISVDCDEFAVEEATRNGCNLMLNHHPLFFSPLRSVDFQKPIGRTIRGAIVNDIIVYAMHTNLDVHKDGVNRELAKRCFLEEVDFLQGEEKDRGLGYVGKVEECDASEYLRKVKDSLQVDGVTVYGELNRRVQRVAVVGGAGSDLIPAAIAADADLMITADIKYHEAQAAVACGLVLADFGHYETEWPVLDMLHQRLSKIEGLRIVVERKKNFRKFL